MASKASDTSSADRCDQLAGGLSPEKRAAWVGFMRSHAAITRALDADLIANVGIPMSAFEALFAVTSSDEGRLRMSEIAEESGLSPSRISRVVTELERRGLLRRTSCPEDSRVTYAVITDAGRELVAKVQELHFEGIERRFFSGLTERQIGELGELWPRVLEASGAAG
jgi:DNA-binding MarR family transcriptional regulator